MSVLEIKQEIAKMEAEKKSFRFDLVRMCWYMRGGMTLNEAYLLPPQDREIVFKLVEENMENVKKTKLPLL